MKKNQFLIYVKKTWKYTKDCRKSLVLYILVCLIEAIIGAILPIFTSQIILKMTDGLIEQLIYTSIAVFVIELVYYITMFCKSFLDQTIYSKTLTNLQVAVAKETLKLEVKEIDKETSGYFIDRLNKDTSDISNLFSEYIYYFSYVISNIGVLVAIFILNKYLFIYTLITTILIYLINKKRIKNEYSVRKKLKIIQENKTGLIGELVRGIRDIKVLNANKTFLDKTETKIKESANEEIKLIKIRRSYNLIESITRIFFYLMLIIFGCFLYQKSLLTIPSFLIIFNYQTKVRNLLSGVVRISEYNKSYILSSERIFNVIENKNFSKEKFGKTKIKKLNGNIEFKNVEFGYNNRKIIQNMNFKIKANQKIGFVGKSGVGKTTIFNLITKLYNIQNGEILLDNYNINELDEKSLRNNISIITQNPYIFNFTIKENLAIAKKDASMKEIREACKLACIDDFIMSLPEQYDTKVGENGIILSGGQKQRLAIARALLLKTEIILFDEATSSLDNETQNKIQKAIENLKGEYTILIIAHRLSTIVDCDKIFVVDDGKIIDIGTHKELIEKSKFYKKLYEKEFDKKY